MDVPIVIAAGQKSIPSKKSGLLFPAILLQFPTHCLSDNTCSSEVYTVWRVKRDFLQLNRVVQRYSKLSTNANHSDTPIFQKKAYTRLCDYTKTKPWVDHRSPNLGQYSSSGKVGFPIEIRGDIQRLNLFLKSLYRLVLCLIETECKNSEALDLIQTWIEFVRNQDTPDLIETLSTDENMLPNKTDHFVGSELKAAALGQYFASEKNAQRVVDYVIQHLSFISKSSSHSCNCFTSKDLRNIVLIEPSCGNGMVIKVLLNTLEKLGIDEDRMPYIIGYDIDENVSAEVRSIGEKRCGSIEGHEAIYFKCCNFLQQTKDDVLKDVLETKRLRKRMDYSKRAQNDDVDALANLGEMHLVILGGPPYSSGLGCGSRIDRELPIHFIFHSIQDLGAEFVTFLLPIRCNKHVQQIKNRLNHRIISDELGDSTGIHSSWICKAFNLDADSLFYFQGTQVIQPSVIQCWMTYDPAK